MGGERKAAQAGAGQQHLRPPPLSSIRSQSLSTKFAFVYDNPRFSDAVLVLQTHECTPAPLPRRIVSAAAHLWLKATAYATTAAWTLTGGRLLPGHQLVAGAGTWACNQASELLSQLLPLQEAADTAARTIHVSSAILAAASPVFKALLEHAPTAASATLPSFLTHGTRTAQSYGDRCIMILPVQPNQVVATEVVVKHAFTGDLPAFGSSSEVLRVLLAAERLQAAECAELCRQQLEEPSAMDWDATLLLLHWQHAEQARRQYAATTGAAAAHAGNAAARWTSSSMGAAAANAASHDLPPPEPLPSESAHLAPLLARAQDLVLQQFEDLEVVWADAAQRARLLGLPYDAVRAVLGHPRLKVASENTVLLAAAAWLVRNEAADGFVAGTVAAAVAWGQQQPIQQPGGVQVLPHAATGTQDASSSVTAGWPQVYMAKPANPPQQQAPASKHSSADSTAEDVRNVPDSKLNSLDDWALLNQQERQQRQQPAPEGLVSDEEGPAFQDVCEEALPVAVAEQREILAATANEMSRTAHLGQQAKQQQQQQQHQQQEQQEGECSGRAAAGVSRLEDLCMNAVRVPLLSYTYLLHVLPRLQPFQHNPALVTVLQSQALCYQAATAPRQAHMAAEAASTAPATATPTTTSTATPTASRYSRRPASERSVLDFCYSFAPEQLSGSALPLLPRYHQISSFGRGKQGGVNQRGGAGAGSRALVPEQQPCLVSEDHSFGGFTWNLVVTRDGFVGITWKMGPGIPSQELQLESSGAEVGMVFAISALAGSHEQGQWQQQGQQEQQAKESANAAGVLGQQSRGSGVGVKGVEVAGAHTRAYSSVQFVPANCAWGFMRFWGAAGAERFRDEQGLVTLRCVVSYVD